MKTNVYWKKSVKILKFPTVIFEIHELFFKHAEK